MDEEEHVDTECQHLWEYIFQALFFFLCVVVMTVKVLAIAFCYMNSQSTMFLKGFHSLGMESFLSRANLQCF